MVSRRLSAVLVLSLLVGLPHTAAAVESEEEAPESAVSSPPMEMDDPGTPGPEGIEVNLVGTLERVGHGRRSEGLLDANYGIGDRIQLKYERPYLTDGGGGLPFQTGMGATELGIKWRFLDSHGMEAALYPQYQFDDGFALKDEEGIREETEGRSVYFPLLMSRSLGKRYTVAVNLGYRRNLEGRGDDKNLALGAGRAVGHDGRILAEVFSERDEHFNDRQTDLRVGYFFTLFPTGFGSAKVELPAFTSIGHSLGRTEDGENATSFVFGMSFIRKPKG